MSSGPGALYFILDICIRYFLKMRLREARRCYSSDVADASTLPEVPSPGKAAVTGCLSQAAPALLLCPCSADFILHTDTFCDVPEVWKSKAGRTKQEDRRMFNMKPEAAGSLHQHLSS